MTYDKPLVAWDTETFLIGIDQIVPGLICSSTHDLQSKESDVYHRFPHEDHYDMLHYLFTETNVIGHNIAGFDLGVAAKYDERLRPLIWRALNEGRVHCTMLREMLLSLATRGSLDEYAIAGRRISYSLDSLLFKYTGIDIKEEKEDEAAPRTNYRLMADVPLEDWPDNFLQYAIDDAEHTAKIFAEQEIIRQQMIGERGFDPFQVSAFRTRAHFALAQMTPVGNELDPKEVLRVTEEFSEMYKDPRLVDPLVEAGIVSLAQPPKPYADGRQTHPEECRGHKMHAEFKAWGKERTAMRKVAVKEGMDAKEAKMLSPCDCPPVMVGAKNEHEDTGYMHELVWDLAKETPGMEVWAAPSLMTLLGEAKLKDKLIIGRQTINQEAVREYMLDEGGATTSAASGLPAKWLLCVDKDWMASFADLTDIMSTYAERKKIQKIVTSYLPKLYWAEGYQQCPDVLEGETSRLAGKQPAKRVYAGYSPLVTSGRCSSRAATKGKGKKQQILFPSWNGQQVDPRMRGCVVAEGYLDTGVQYPDLSTYQGNVFFSLDYDGMELGTLAQTCFNLFGYSVMKDLINAGVNLHTYLGAQIAYEFDPDFATFHSTSEPMHIYENFLEMKGFDEPCDLPQFLPAWAEFNRNNPNGVPDPTWGGFFSLYRTFAKPTDLGKPGGLGNATFRAMAKGTYGLLFTEEEADKLDAIWRREFPECDEYLKHASKGMEDQWNAPDIVEDDNGKLKKNSWRAYSSPLGMHRAHCSYSAAANGLGLQTPGAEGALMATSNIMQEIQTGTRLEGVNLSLMIHDELAGTMKWEGIETTKKLDLIAASMKKSMEKVTPDVNAAAEPCLMFRWNKKADPVYRKVGGTEMLVPWAPGIWDSWKSDEEQPKEMK